MAIRPVFTTISSKPYYSIKETEFKFYPGFAVSQKQKSIEDLHRSYLKAHPTEKILEISSKSTERLGVDLSAFNLTIQLSNGRKVPVEVAFQSSKVFTNGGPYRDLLLATPIDAKKDERLKNSGMITGFNFDGNDFSSEPKTLFYNWLYINALHQHPQLAEELLKYSAFTDIEFNPQRSLNCQAMAAAIYVSLARSNKLTEALSSPSNFNTVVFEKESINHQLSIFDVR